jgi:amidase
VGGADRHDGPPARRGGVRRRRVGDASDRERAALYRRFAEFFRDWDVLVTPGAPTPAWDVMVRARNEIDGVKLTNYIAGSVLTSAITLTACPAVSVPCGFDRHGRPIGLQIVAPARGEETALAAAALFEQSTGLDRLLPIEPREGTVPA